jgi:hypothetical protein
MASFDLGNKLSLAYSIVPAATTANTVGGAVDTQGFEAVCAFGLSQAITALDASNYFTLTLKEGDTDVEANATAVPASRIVSNTGRLNATNKIIKATFTPFKRYVFVGLAETGTANAVVGTAVALGNPHKTPTA